MQSTALVSFFTVCAFATTPADEAVMSCQQWMVDRRGSRFSAVAAVLSQAFPLSSRTSLSARR
jgi:hypothetical protein